MKMTLELPEKLMRAVKIKAAESDRNLNEVVAELIERGLESGKAAEAGEDPLRAWVAKLVIEEDGTVTNPDGIEHEEFFDSLRELRKARSRDPFADLD